MKNRTIPNQPPDAPDLITNANGYQFPAFNGEALSWLPGLYSSRSEEQAGYPRARVVIAAMKKHRPEQFERERRELLKDSFDRMFGHNAKKLLALFEEAG